MGIYFNPDGMNFKLAYNARIFVDKSEIIKFTNERINCGDDRFIYVSRPRRFGKSYIANMLCAYYSKSSSCGEIFDNLNISASPDYIEHRNKYHVICMDMHSLLIAAHDDVDELKAVIIKRIKRDIRKAFPDFDDDTDDLQYLLELFYQEYNEQIIFIIDEWDCVFRVLGSDKQRETYLNFFRALLKGQSYVALAYMTGILPIKQYGRESVLNMFDESSMARPGAFAKYIGFTSDDVKELCRKYEFDFDTMKYWYDGYSLKGNEMYCSNSVVSAIKNGEFLSYWTQTTAYENLADYIARNESGLHDDIETLLTGQRIPVNPNMFSNDMFRFRAKNDVLTLLVHLGYLACIPIDTNNQDEKYEAYIPNKEIRNKFDDSISQTGLYEESIKRNEKSMELLNFTLKGDADKVAQIIDEAHADIDPRHYNNEEALRSVIKEAYIMVYNFYDIRTEFPAGKGYADVVFIPKPNRDVKFYPPILIELKYNKSVQSAVEQINDRDYQRLFGSYKKVLLVAISYNKKDKHHECSIIEEEKDE